MMHIQTCVSVQFVFCCEEEIDLVTVAYLVLIRQLRNLCDIDRLMAYLYGNQQLDCNTNEYTSTRSTSL